jgi:hypothetical protein
MVLADGDLGRFERFEIVKVHHHVIETIDNERDLMQARYRIVS